MKQKDETMVRWNEFLKPKHECPYCAEQFKYKYNWNIHLAKYHASRKKTDSDKGVSTNHIRYDDF